jgi:hypothetical protein
MILRPKSSLNVQRVSRPAAVSRGIGKATPLLQAGLSRRGTDGYPMRFLIFAQEGVIRKLSSMSATIRANFFIGTANVKTPSGT